MGVRFGPSTSDAVRLRPEWRRAAAEAMERFSGITHAAREAGTRDTEITALVALGMAIHMDDARRHRPKR